MKNKRPFKFRKNDNSGDYNNQQYQNPKKENRPVNYNNQQRPNYNNKSNDSNTGYSNEFTSRDGEYSLYAKLDKDSGRLIKGFKKIQIYNASLRVSASGGKIRHLEAYYQTKSGTKRISKISPSNNYASFDVMYSDIPNNRLKVTVICKIKMSFTRSKELKLSVFLNI